LVDLASPHRRRDLQMVNIALGLTQLIDVSSDGRIGDL
jgi:hypothetical protein